MKHDIIYIGIGNSLKKFFGFSGWSVCSYLSSSFVSQAYNLLLNLFFGPAVNAARAISYQIQGAINNFSANFQTALNPQIIKNYATLNLQRVYELVILSMKVSFSLVYILMVPILINIDWILNIWLNTLTLFLKRVILAMKIMGLLI